MKKALLFVSIVLSLPLFVNGQGDEPMNPKVILVGADQEINCTSDPVEIGIRIDHWVEGFSYQWSTSETDSIISVKPAITRSYDVSITNPIINFSVVRTITVDVFNEPVLVSDATVSVDKNTCPGSDVTLEVTPSGGYLPYTYSWSNGQTGATSTVQPTQAESYQVEITDQCGSKATAIVEVEFEEHALLEVPMGEQIIFNCDGEEISLIPDLSKVVGGVGHGYTYSFDGWINSDKPLELEAADGVKVEAEITDACGIQKETIEFTLIKEDLDIRTTEDEVVCQGTKAVVTALDDGFYYWDGEVMHAQYEFKASKEEHFELEYIDACGETQHVDKRVSVYTLDAHFDAFVNDFERTVQLSANSADRIQWYVNGEPIEGEQSIEILLEETDVNEITLEIENEDGCTANSTKTVVLRDGVDAPTAFSPNGDGINDRWSVRIDEELLSFNVKIFDRWGQLLYESNDQYFEWDAEDATRDQPLNTFAFVLKGVTTTGRVIEKRGTITTMSSK